MNGEKLHDPFCERCWGSGTCDTGGFQPWGEPILEDCDCHIDFSIDRQKRHFALQLAEQVMADLEKAPFPVGANHLKSYIKLAALDAIEFGIQLGGMGLKEGE